MRQMDERAQPPPQSPPDLIKGDANTELAANRTSLSFERTRMSSDNTLMSTVRTSLSLIGFGFTIYQVLGKASGVLPKASMTARNAGLAMLLLGMLVLIMGIISHTLYDRALARRRDELHDANLLRHAADYHMTPTYFSAVALLVIAVGLAATIIIRMLR